MHKTYKLALTASAILGAAGLIAFAQMPQSPKTTPADLPKPYATPSANNPPTLIAKPGNAQLRAPSGFEVQVWAEGFARPRFMLAGRHGEVFLSDSGKQAGGESPNSRASDGVVYVFRGGDPHHRKALIRGMNRPYGLALWQNYLYVG